MSEAKHYGMELEPGKFVIKLMQEEPSPDRSMWERIGEPITYEYKEITITHGEPNAPS